MAGYVAFAWGLFLFSVIVIALHPYGERSDLVRRRVSAVLDSKKQNMDLLEEELSKPLWERFIRPLFKSLSSRVEKYTAKNQNDKNNNSGKIKKTLHMAGYTMTVGEYRFLQLIVILVTAGVFGAYFVFSGIRDQVAPERAGGRIRRVCFDALLSGRACHKQAQVHGTAASGRAGSAQHKRGGGPRV
jgi:hypothetical protein